MKLTLSKTQRRRDRRVYSTLEKSALVVVLRTEKKSSSMDDSPVNSS